MKSEMDKKTELSELDDLTEVLDKIEKKYEFRCFSVTLSEEECFTLTQINVITGLSNSMIFKIALTQLLKEIVTKKQRTKHLGEKTFLYPQNENKNLRKRKLRSCSSNMPFPIHQAIAVFAKKNNMKAYEAYSQVVDEFLQFAKDSENPIIYQECPKDALKKSVALFEESRRGLKALKQRDQVTDYLVLYNAALRFIEKHKLLTEVS